MEWLKEVADSLILGAALFWKAFWALALGYAFSSVIQVFVSRRQAAKHLGRAGPREMGIAVALGAIASSCSFAALSATRSLFAKGAHLITALAFMFASTNLAVEVGAMVLVFLGWQFTLALYLGAFVLVIVMAVLVRLTYPARLVDAGRERAERIEAGETEPAHGLPERWAERARDSETWRRVGTRFVAEWSMVWKELLAGFAVAGFVATLVPQEFFAALFPADLPAVIQVPLHALLAVVLAPLTVIGSMGNGPLAAILWQNGVVFAGIMAFLFSDFIVPPSLRINAKYYGWRLALYLGIVFAIAAVVAGTAMHAAFAVLGLIPQASVSVEELATFALDYTFVLNVAAAVVAIALLLASRLPPARRIPAEARAKGR